MPAVWTSPDTWVDSECIECGGAGAPCCDPPDHQYPADPITQVYVEAAKAMGERIDELQGLLDTLGSQRAALLTYLDGCDNGGGSPYVPLLRAALGES